MEKIENLMLSLNAAFGYFENSPSGKNEQDIIVGQINSAILMLGAASASTNDEEIREIIECVEDMTKSFERVKIAETGTGFESNGGEK